MATMLYVWGRGDDGQIGVGDTSDQLYPVPIEHLRKENVISAACGSGHTMALTKQGRIYSWGRNDDGRLGHGTEHGGWKYIPKRVESLVPIETIQAISSGSYHSAAISTSGAVYTWGGGLFGKLGFGNESGRLSPARVSGVLQGEVVTSLSCGSRHTLALTEQGEVFSWGDRENGVTGHHVTESHQYTPKLITTLQGLRVISIGACGAHSGVVTACGQLFTFGDGKFGRLGHGNENTCLIPRRVEALRGKLVKLFAAGGFHSCCVTDTGQLYTWGGNQHSQLGLNDRVGRNSPCLVESLVGHSVTQISAGWSHNICLCENDVYSWGNGDHGKLGRGDTVRVPIPKRIEFFQGMKVISVVSYNEHTAAIVQLSDDASSSATGCGSSEDSETRYLRDFRNLLFDETFSDVTFVVEGRPIQAHRAVLAARSEHFSSMFRSGMRESTECKVVIPNCRFTIFFYLLEFLYTNQVQSLSGEDALELYVLGDLYQLDDLKNLCKDFLVRSLSLQTASPLFVAANHLHVTILRELCLNYIVRYFDTISKTKEFAELSKDLLLEILQKRSPVAE